MNNYHFFEAGLISTLRASAENARRLKIESIPEGWSSSQVNPMKLLEVFPSLKIKSEYVLHAYQFRLGGNGHGIVFALPKDLPLPEPEIYSNKSSRDFEPPYPLGALVNVMEVIEGDGTPWSYLSASIFAREVDEFGAMWHGNDWTTHTIIDSIESLRPQHGLSSKVFDIPSTDPDEWEWIDSKPEDWRPKFYKANGQVTVEFFSYSGLGTQSLFKHIDTYKPETHCCEIVEKVIARGPMGFVF